jgi:chemotaxis family two-component system response regulator PixH
MADDPSPKMLLIENDPGFLYLMRRYADRAACQLIATSEVRKALALAETEQPTLVLVSDRPGATGHEIVRGLEANPATRHIPVFLCSTSDAAPPAWRDEVDGYLVKPIMYEDFLNLLAGARIRTEPAGEAAPEGD